MSARSPARTSSPAAAVRQRHVADDQVFGVDVPQAEEQLGTVVEPAADAVEHGGRVLAHHRPVGTVASEGNLAGFREQAAVGIGDDAQDVIGQPSLEQLEHGSDPARALGPDGLPGGLPELPDAHDDVIEVRSDDHGVDPAGVDVQVTDGTVADIRAAPRQAVLEVRARFQMVAPAPAPEAAGDGASLDVDGLHVHAVPAQLVRDPGHSGAPGADGNVGWKPAHGGFLRRRRGRPH